MYILEKNVEIQMNEEWSSISFSAGVLIKSERSLSNLIKIRLLNPIPYDTLHKIEQLSKQCHLRATFQYE